MSLPLFVTLYLVLAVAQLTAYRVLMVWLFERTDSLLIVALAHASLIVSTVQTVFTPETTGAAFLTWFGGFTVALWAAVPVLVTGSARPERGDASCP